MVCSPKLFVLLDSHTFEVREVGHENKAEYERKHVYGHSIEYRPIFTIILSIFQNIQMAIIPFERAHFSAQELRIQKTFE